MFNVCEAVAGGVLDAPSLPVVRPFDLGPHLPVDHEVVGFGVDPVNLDHAVASAVGHFGSSPLKPDFHP
jgi:hypothetical protein